MRPGFGVKFVFWGNLGVSKEEMRSRLGVKFVFWVFVRKDGADPCPVGWGIDSHMESLLPIRI